MKKVNRPYSWLWIKPIIAHIGEISISWAINTGWMDDEGIEIDLASELIRGFNLAKRTKAFLDHTHDERCTLNINMIKYKPFSYRQYLADKKRGEEFYANFLKSPEGQKWQNQLNAQ